VLAEYQGLTVAEITELRASLKERGGQFKVVKNTLARIAAEGTALEGAREYFRGPVGVALGYDDPVQVVKAVVQFAEDSEKLRPTAAVLEGRLVPVEELKRIAQLPPREVLLGMLAAAMAAPTVKLAQALQATVGQMAWALEALRQKRQQET
jgi:large subunit ribosomal protein L10